LTDSTTYAGLSVLGTVLGKVGLTGDSNCFCALIDRNAARSTVRSCIEDADVAAAGHAVLVAWASARTRAREDSDAVLWTGRSGIIATNVVLSEANAYVVNSRIATSAAGGLTLDAQNFSLVDAIATSKIESWDSATAVLAFNSIGWEAQN